MMAWAEKLMRTRNSFRQPTRKGAPGDFQGPPRVTAAIWLLPYHQGHVRAEVDSRVPAHGRR
jgi:hypothetical protein